MQGLFERILESEAPSETMRDAVSQEEVLRLLNQHIFSSLFSTYVAGHSPSWTEQVAETALQLLFEDASDRNSHDLLLEIAFHASLVLVGTDDFRRNFIQIERALQRLERRDVSRSSQYVKGLLAYARGDLTAAEHAFNSLPEVLDTPMLAYQASYPAFRAPSFYQTLTNYEPSLQLDFIQGPKNLADASTVLLCSADDHYFAAFADEFATQALSISASAHIHFHLINNATDPSLLTATDLLANDRVSVSVEQTKLPKPGWYAIMARYIVLPLLMLEYRRPVLVTDIDLIIRGDPVDIKAGSPVTLNFSSSPAARLVPSTSILGGHSLFQPSNAGLEFAQILSRYLCHVREDQRGVWVADQISLLMVWRMLRNIIPVGSFADVPSYSFGPPADRPMKKHAATERLNQLKQDGMR